MPSAQYEAIIIGSGFGGTIISLSLANKYEKEGQGKRVCLLERGQWWISHEIPSDKEETLDHKSTIREYLEENGMPYGLFPYPDNLQGLLKVFGNLKALNKVKGLYDYRSMRNINIITASGVGGGSLVYFNVTEKPDPSVFTHWPTEKDGCTSLSRYFDVAESFLGVNYITTTAALGRYRLARTNVFQNAANSINNKYHNVINSKKENGKPNLDAKLSITDVFNDLSVVADNNNLHPTIDKVQEYSKEENVCQRHGRCGLGCITDARHSLEKKIYTAINRGKPVEIFPLCEVVNIEENQHTYYKYKINFIDRRENKDGIKSTVEAKLVVLAAGALGSTEILLRSKNLNLSKTLGTQFSTNADLFGVINPTKESIDPTTGPTITSIVKLKNKIATNERIFSIEDIGIPKMFAEVFATIFDLMFQQKQARSFIDILKDIIFGYRYVRTTDYLAELIKVFDTNSSNILVAKIKEISHLLERTVLHSNKNLQFSEDRVNNILILFAMGVDDGRGHLIIDNNKSLNLKDDYDLEQPLYNDIINTMRMFAKEIGKEGENSFLIPFWNKGKSKTAITAHPLGGCPMGGDAASGVVDSKGRVFKGSNGVEIYDGLYVVDGSIIPTPLGVNPSLTIAALSFRIALNIIGGNEHLLPI